MGKYREYVDRQSASALMGYVKIQNESYQNSNNDAAVVDPKEEYFLSLESRFTPGKRLTYETLANFITMTGTTVKELYRIVGVVVPEPDEDIQELVTRCNALSDNQKERLYKIIMKNTPDWWRSPEIEALNPSLRTLQLFEHRTNRGSRYELISNEALKKAWEDQAFSTTIDFRELPDINRQLHGSLSWLLKNIGWVYSEDEKIEQIVTAFTFLKPQVREWIIDGLKCMDGQVD